MSSILILDIQIVTLILDLIEQGTYDYSAHAHPIEVRFANLRAGDGGTMVKQRVAAEIIGSRDQRNSPSKRLLADRIVWRSVSDLAPFPNNPRVHPASQIAALTRSMRQGWTNPILVDEANTILAGHGRLQAAQKLGLSTVPTLMLSGLSAAEKLSVVIADNKLPEQSVWDVDALKMHFQVLDKMDYDLELTGFTTGEIDIVLDGTSAPPTRDPDDEFEDLAVGPAISQAGDLWLLGDHRILCGDSQLDVSTAKVMRGDKAQMVVTDPPYNLKIQGNVRGRTARKYPEFAMASGEMSEQQFEDFLARAITQMIGASVNGSIHYICMDWRHLPELLAAGRAQYSEWKNLLVWNKSNAGLGAFYRSKYELVAVFKAGNAPHINNFGMGEKGRYRTNVLDYAGATAFGKNRDETFDPHPTVKPCALIADLMRDCSRRNGIIFDPFGGSGTTLLAAQRTRRRARLIELDPAYVDLTVRRWEKTTGLEARHESSGQTFKDLERQRPPQPTSSLQKREAT